MLHADIMAFPEQQSVSLVTTRMIAPLVTPGLGLAQQDLRMIPTPVETMHLTNQITETKTSRSWDIF